MSKSSNFRTVKPDWITVGAPVLTYSSNDRYGSSVRKTTITKVTPTTFTIEANNIRFKTGAEPQRHDGGSFGWTTFVIPLTSDKARQLLATRKAAVLRYAARLACDEYIKKQTTENRTAAISALQAVTEDRA